MWSKLTLPNWLHLLIFFLPAYSAVTIQVDSFFLEHFKNAQAYWPLCLLFPRYFPRYQRDCFFPFMKSLFRYPIREAFPEHMANNCSIHSVTLYPSSELGTKWIKMDINVSTLGRLSKVREKDVVVMHLLEKYVKMLSTENGVPNTRCLWVVMNCGSLFKAQCVPPDTWTGSCLDTRERLQRGTF